MAEPPAKRLKTAPSAGGEERELMGEWPKKAPEQGLRTLRQTLLVVLFLVRVSVKSADPVTASLAQIGAMVQRQVDRAFNRCQEIVSSKLECLEGQIQSLRKEVRQLSHLCSNRHAGQHPSLEPNQEHATASGSKRHSLRFSNDLKPPIYTEKNLIGENNAAIKVAMFEGDKMITSGPLSKVNVEILVLRGDFPNNRCEDWTEEEFDNHIVKSRDGQDLLLGTVRLTNGEVELSQIRFKEVSYGRNVIIGARVSKNEKTAGQVREAVTKPVKVLDRRNEGNEKRRSPRLDDAVYRLKKIAKGGEYHKRLQKKNIHTVEDFLKFLHKDSEMLCEILQMQTRTDSWSKLTAHARECVLEERPGLKRYQSEEGNLVLFFNCVHDLVGAGFPGGYVARGGFDASQKASVNKWKACAYAKLDDIPPDFVMKDNIPCPISSITNAAAGASVLAAGSSQSNFSADRFAEFQGTGAAENSQRSASNHVTSPMYPSAGNNLLVANPGYINAHDYQAQGIAVHVQQPMDPGSTMPGYQQNPATLMNPYHTAMDALLASAPWLLQTASTSRAQLPAAGGQLGDSSHFSPSPMSARFLAGLSSQMDSCSCDGMDLLRPWCPQHGGQGPNCSGFSGSGPSNGYS